MQRIETIRVQEQTLNWIDVKYRRMTKITSHSIPRFEFFILRPSYDHRAMVNPEYACHDQ